MALPRSAHFNADVDPDLLTALQTVGEGYAPYKVQFNSGYRPGDPRMHGKGGAVDVQLLDPASGAALANYQDASTATAYQAYAQAVYQWAQKNNPALAQKLRWGGYFSGGAGKYGALDLMHFDVGGGEGGLGMAGGSWAGGWTPEMLDTWGLKEHGGVGGAVSSDPQVAFMQQYWPQALRVSQATGIDPRVILSQAALESAYGKSAPGNNLFGIKGGTGEPVETTEIINGKPTRVMARFEGYKSPEESFDAYSKFMMGDRYAPVRSAKGWEAQLEALGQSGYATDPDYAKKLREIAAKVPEGGYPGGTSTESSIPGYSSGSAEKPATPGAAASAAEPKKKGFLERAADAFGDVNFAANALPKAALPAAPAAASRVDAPEVPPIISTADPARRQELAALMARLNKGVLF